MQQTMIFKLHVNGNASASLTSNNSTLTTNDITRGPIACTGSGTKATVPTAAGVYIGMDSAGAGGIEICASSSQYSDFTSTGIDHKGRMIYSSASDIFAWHVGLPSTARLTLSATALMCGTTTLASSDKGLKFNENPFNKRLDAISRLKPVEYDQTHDLVEHTTPDTPQSHQCGFKAQRVQQIDELKYAVAGSNIDEQGKETIRYLNYNSIFPHAVKTIQELSDIVKQQQEQIDVQKQQIDRLEHKILKA